MGESYGEKRKEKSRGERREGSRGVGGGVTAKSHKPEMAL